MTFSKTQESLRLPSGKALTIRRIWEHRMPLNPERWSCRVRSSLICRNRLIRFTRCSSFVINLSKNEFGTAALGLILLFFDRWLIFLKAAFVEKKQKHLCRHKNQSFWPNEVLCYSTPNLFVSLSIQWKNGFFARHVSFFSGCMRVLSHCQTHFLLNGSSLHLESFMHGPLHTTSQLVLVFIDLL